MSRGAPRSPALLESRARSLCCVALLLALQLSACAMVPGESGESLVIDGLTFENRSQSPVDSISLMAPATGGFVSCGRIAPGARCAAGFPDVNYEGQPLEVRWNQGGADWNNEIASLQASEEVRMAGRAQVRVVVIAPGSAGVLLLPSSGDELP